MWIYEHEGSVKLIWLIRAQIFCLELALQYLKWCAVVSLHEGDILLYIHRDRQGAGSIMAEMGWDLAVSNTSIQQLAHH